MKNIFFAFALFLCTAVEAQEQTLLGETEIEHGGYGGPVIKAATINNEPAILVGGRGGWIINHVFSIGLAGYGLANNIPANTVGPFGRKYLELGYGGLDLEFIANSDDLIHFSIHTLVGGGSAGFRSVWDDNNWHAEYNMGYQHDPFFIVEPGINLDLNVTPWVRTSVGAGYRYVTGLSSAAATNSDIRGGSGMLTFRFGKF